MEYHREASFIQGYRSHLNDYLVLKPHMHSNSEKSICFKIELFFLINFMELNLHSHGMASGEMKTLNKRASL